MMASGPQRDDDELEIVADSTEPAPSRGAQVKKKPVSKQSLISGVSADDSDEAWGESSRAMSDADYEADRPPHW